MSLAVPPPSLPASALPVPTTVVMGDVTTALTDGSDASADSEGRGTDGHEADGHEADGHEADALPPQLLGRWQPVDGRAVRFWRELLLLDAVLIAGFLLALVAVARFLGAARPTLGETAMLVAVVAAYGVAQAWVLPRRRHRAVAWRLDAHDLRVRSGVWWRTLTVVPLARIEHVRTQSDPLQRRHGLATVVAQTAGSSNADAEVPALDAVLAERLRETLARRSRETAPTPLVVSAPVGQPWEAHASSPPTSTEPAR